MVSKIVAFGVDVGQIWKYFPFSLNATLNFYCVDIKYLLVRVSFWAYLLMAACFVIHIVESCIVRGRLVDSLN